MRNTPFKGEYRSWQMMKNRCLNPRAEDYRYYGARGITVHLPWAKSFDQFMADMGPKPDPSYTLERDEGAKGYSPDNCRWATRQTQAQNRAYAQWHGWELAQQLGVSKSRALGLIWMYRQKMAGNKPAYYDISEAREVLIKEHLERLA